MDSLCIISRKLTRVTTGLNHKIGFFLFSEGLQAPSPSDIHFSLGEKGTCRFAVVRFGSVWFGGVRQLKKGKHIKCLWCPPAHTAAETVNSAGSVGFAGQGGLAPRREDSPGCVVVT